MVVLTVVLIVAEVLLITAVVPVHFTVLRRIIPSHVCVYRYRPANKKLLQYGIWSEPQITINICCSRPGDFLYHVYHPPKVLNRLSHVDCSYSCRIFGKGDPCLEFSMAVSAGSGTRRPQPAAASNKLPGINKLETKHNIRSQSRYLCVLHSCRPSTRSAPPRVPPRCH